MEHLSAISKSAKAPAIQLGAVGRVRCEPHWRLGPEWAARLKDFDLWFIWEGRGHMQTSFGRVELRPGLCFWMRPGRHYEAGQQLSHRLGVNFVHFTLPSPVRSGAMEPPFEMMETRHLAYVDETMQRIIELCAEGSTSVATTVFSGLLQSLIHESRQTARQATTGLERHHRETVTRIARQIRESPGQIGSVATLARKAGYSVDHFSRIFRKFTGKRPQQFAIDAKMARARQLLAESGFTVGEVAAALGFENRHFFTRQFFQRNACTPTAFRKRPHE